LPRNTDTSETGAVPRKLAVAVGHSILVIAYYVLEREVTYEELGEDYFHRQRSGEAYTKRLVRQLERLGHKVVLEPLTPIGEE
jgi:transposase